MKKLNLSLLILTTVLSFSCKQTQKEEPATAALTEDEINAKALKIQKEIITLDTHCDFNVNNFTDSINYTQELETQITLPKMEAGGLDVAWFIVYTGQDSLTESGYKAAYENAMAKFNAIHKLCEEIAPDEIELALTSDDVRRIHAKGKKVAMIGIENGYSIGTDLNNVKKFYDLGGRYMSLAHQGHSQLADSNTGEKDSVWLNNGLSELGKQVIAKMNKYGMMIDVSHPSKEAMRQMIELTKAPIIASHSSARALSNHSRNLDDEQLQWLKGNGGVVQTVAFSPYVSVTKDSIFKNESKKVLEAEAQKQGFELLERDSVMTFSKEKREAYYQKYIALRNNAAPKLDSLKKVADPVNVADFVDHIDYLIEKVGIDHVGISSDFDGGGGIYGWNDASETLNVTKELVRRGYTKTEIEKLWSGNLLRVLDEVQAVAQKIQQEE
ncbi:Zn-dependent dipeptidase, microsomal dipeptidase [Galbibacter orientalis DSM 19592]|uniref:Zn-dependent dipeptidase, microsomal dipeptidase n=1 Tax=Galbibacter orientalis DSM 19592 TaxID=926559 RepID=I3CA81_9FLAO|nr:dipeptidase [Galbibacter orientalis]EIJ40524.1 Zn-dependent dipeptidase, microsomal dipeptidase [Galbibacter orientalis DSM 19592]